MNQFVGAFAHQETPWILILSILGLPNLFLAI